jgi:hypothetical protein
MGGSGVKIEVGELPGSYRGNRSENLLPTYVKRPRTFLR